MVTNHSTPRMAYPELRTTKEDKNVDFSFLRWQLFTSDQAEALEREIFLLRSALGAECLSTPRIAFAKKTQEWNVKCASSTRNRNVRRTSKHFPTTKVDFLTIKVVLAITRTITVSRNEIDDFRTEGERLAYGYGSRPYMQFPVFVGRGKRGGGGVRGNFKPLYLGNGWR